MYTVMTQCKSLTGFMQLTRHYSSIGLSAVGTMQFLFSMAWYMYVLLEGKNHTGAFTPMAGDAAGPMFNGTKYVRKYCITGKF